MTARAHTVYGDAAAALASGNVDLLTCDVFDTLVWRPVAEPNHLFLAVGAALRELDLLPATVDTSMFLEWRRLAERLAREEAHRVHGSAECTLAEIWQRLPGVWRSTSLATYADVELDVERRHLRAIEPGVDLLRAARAAAVPVVLISDTYLSGAQVTHVLDAAGVPLDLVDAIVTSSEARLNKSTGLIDDVIARRGVPPGRVLHVGDHPGADLEAAHRAGAQAVRLDPDDTDWISSPMGRALLKLSREHGSDGGARALGRLLRLLDGAGSDRPRPLHSAAYDFGATVGGPLLAGFADWMVTRCAALGVDSVHYLLREGAFLADAVGAARPDAAPSPRLVHASRWVTTRASVFDGTPDEIGRALARRARFHPSHVTEAFGLDPQLVRSVVGDHELDDEHRQLAMGALAADDRTRAAIVDASAEIRGRLMQLYERELHPEAGRLVLCDIGWGGSIQSAISQLLDRAGWDVDVIGLYLMLSQPGLDRVRLGASMEGFLPAGHPNERQAFVVMRTAEISEQLCTTDRQTLVDVDDQGEPILARASTAAAASVSRRRAQNGVIDFLRARPIELAARTDDLDAVATALLDGYAGTIDRPDRWTARELGQWTHDDIAGTGSEPLVGDRASSLLRFANAARSGLVTMRDLYWLQGAAALAGHSIAAEIEAVELGVDPEALCPPSELGTALIAVFCEGELDAVAQIRIDPHRNAEGWSLMRLTGNGSSIRAIRFDVGEFACLVEVGELSIRIGETMHVVTDMFDARLRWVGGHPLSRRRFIVRDGGYFTFDPSDAGNDVSGVVEATIAFRGTQLDDDELRHFPAPLGYRVGSVVRRVRRRLVG